MEKGIESITGGNGKNWIKNNLGGIEIDIGDFESNLIGANYVDNTQIHALDNYYKYGYGNYPEMRPDTMIIHEIGHIWDNKMK